MVISLIALVLIGGGLYFNFHNFREERQVKEFLSHLAVQGLQGRVCFVWLHGREAVPLLPVR